MLKQLCIRQFELVEHLDVEWFGGMSAITGETGAGKSMILDALSLVLGERASPSCVRMGSNQCVISAAFALEQAPQAQAWLADNDLAEENPHECLLRRVINAGGQSRAYINGQLVGAAALKQLGQWLVDLHNQHEFQSLLRPSTQAQLFDRFVGATQQAEQTQMLWLQIHKLADQLQQQRQDAGKLSERREDLRFQIDELNKLAPNAEEYYQSEQRFRLMANIEAIQSTSNMVQQSLFDEEHGARQLLVQSTKTLESEETFVELNEFLQSGIINLEEAQRWLDFFQSSLEFDAAEFASLQARVTAYTSIARKHNAQPEKLDTIYQQLQEDLAAIDESVDLAKLEQTLAELKQQWQTVAGELSAKRHTKKALFESHISQMMEQLSFHGGKFIVDLNADEPSSYGLERIEFTVITNLGQPAKPLRKIASGGELSRLSLIIQVVQANLIDIPSLIFDEVDVGIGGSTAEVVGTLLRQLGAKGQVICVTHQPQVAALAHHHWQASKTSINQATFSKLKLLKNAERIQEIARMVGGTTVTEQSLSHAREMIRRAHET